MKSKNKIVIKTFGGSILWESTKDTIKEAVIEKYKKDADLRGADLRGADLRGAELRDADLRDADLRGADLRGIKLKNLPENFINQCSRDILFIFSCLKKELPEFRKKLIEGKINGSQYTGECACLIGTLGNIDGGIEKVCNAIPYYEKGTHNMGETWFLNIREGDTPKNNEFSKHVLKLVDMVLKGK